MAGCYLLRSSLRLHGMLVVVVLLIAATLPGTKALAEHRHIDHSHITPTHRLNTPTCPNERDLLPCVCQLHGQQIHIVCENSEVLKISESLSLLMRYRMPVDELSLIGNKIPSLPARFFASLQVRRLILVQNNIKRISRNAFAGLEGSLEHLYIMDPTLYDLPFVTFDNLANIKTCILENTDISDIPRLYSLKRLEVLRIDGSRVTQIPTGAFTMMPNLKKVQISNSLLKNIDGSALEGLIYLQEINFSNNEIDWIHPGAFRTLDIATHLLLAGNKISDVVMTVIAARELRSLKVFDLQNNRITELRKGSFVDMPTVETINIGNNLISKIEYGSIFKLPSLKIIDVSGNFLRDFHSDMFTETPRIESLNLSRNNLSFVAQMVYIARALPELRSFDLSENRLTAENIQTFNGHRNLEALRLSNNEIRELKKGIFKGLPSLRELHLGNNKIENEFHGQIWNLPKLRVLDLSHNELKKVNNLVVEGLPQLSNLDLSFNLISEVQERTFSGAQYLKKLNLSYNSFENLSGNVFSGLDELYELDMCYNELKSIDYNILKGLKSLELLHITHNQVATINELAFLDTMKLRYLDLSSNFIQELPSETMSMLTELRVFKLHNNAIRQISDAQLSGLHLVEHLDLSNNHIQILTQNAFNKLNVIKDLDLSVNYIQSLHTDIFSNMRLLEKLNISHNYLADLGEQTFSNIKHLRILDLTNNSLTEIGNAVSGLSNLQGLFMSKNYISTLKNSTFQNLPTLNVLHFDNNGLQTFESGTFQHLKSLVYLDLRNNNLVELNPGSFASLYSLKDMKISQNQISVIRDHAYTDLISLQSLELQDNVITEISPNAFKNLPSMKFLNLSRNGLQEVPREALASLPTLDVLDLSWNYILRVEDSSFTSQEWLTVLMLHDNDLCRLTEGAFSNQRGLRVLTLQNNQLKRLHLRALGKTISGLSLLDMTGNPFRCDCELIWLREYLQERDAKGVGTVEPFLGTSLRGIPVCASPDEYKGMPISEVPPSAFLCEGRKVPDSEDEVCAPRFLDPLLFATGSGLNVGALNTMLHLSNLSGAFPHTAGGPSFLDTTNPIMLPVNFRPPSADLVTLSPPKTSATLQIDKLTVPLLNSAQSIQQVTSVTGDTPTIYAGSATNTNTDTNKNQNTETASGLFGGLKLPSLPSLLESLVNLNIPNIGLNVGWGGLPIGRKESSGGILSKTGLVDKSKPMRGPDRNHPIWIEGPENPHPHFMAPPPQPSTAPKFKINSSRQPSSYPFTSLDPVVSKIPMQLQDPLRGPGLALNNVPKRSDFVFPDGLHIIPGSRPSQIIKVSRPQIRPESSQAVVAGHLHPHSVSDQFRPQHNPVIHVGPKPGPGENAGRPFLPGLSMNQAKQVPSGNKYIIEKLPDHALESSHAHSVTSHVEIPSHLQSSKIHQDILDYSNTATTFAEPSWSPPSPIHPDSGVSLYQPNHPFLPVQPNNPNHPISIVDGPDFHRFNQNIQTTPITPISYNSTSTPLIPTTTPSVVLDLTSAGTEKSEISEIYPNVQSNTEDLPQPTLSELLSLLYAAEKEVSKEDSHQFDIDISEQEIQENTQQRKEESVIVEIKSKLPQEIKDTVISSTEKPKSYNQHNSQSLNHQISKGSYPANLSTFSTELQEGSIEQPLSLTTYSNSPSSRIFQTTAPTVSYELNTTPSLPTSRATTARSHFQNSILNLTSSRTSIYPSVLPPALGKGVSVIRDPILKPLNDNNKLKIDITNSTNIPSNINIPNPQSNSRFIKGVVMPVDKNGENLPGTEVIGPINNTYISPSRSIGQGGIPLIERLPSPNIQDLNRKDVHFQGIDIPINTGNGYTDYITDPPMIDAEFEPTEVDSIDWYYNNYYRDLDPYNPKSSPSVGGNKPENSANRSNTNMQYIIIFAFSILFYHQI